MVTQSAVGSDATMNFRVGITFIGRDKQGIVLEDGDEGSGMSLV
jgi:hypothetical protein